MIYPKKSFCYYETPIEVVVEFANQIICYLKNSKSPILKKRSLSVLDVFAGDGRLGKELCGLLKNKGYETTLTFVEIDNAQIKKIKNTPSNTQIIKTNVFKWVPHERFDLIITNPPFEILNFQKSKNLGFRWPDAKKAGHNLYGLSILKCLEIVSHESLLSVISPFSWLRGINSAEFREQLLEKCSEIKVIAFNHRGIFKNVNQDIGFQLFSKRKPSNIKDCKIYFSYNGDNSNLISEPSLNNIKSNGIIRVRVGPVVWNRKKNFLSINNSNSIPLIYGGNIRPDGTLNLKNKNYTEKQYIKKSGIVKTDYILTPVLLIRRTLRGKPGEWKIDFCFLNERIKATAENHTIIVEFIDDAINFKDFNSSLIKALHDYYYCSGSPNISVKIVKKLAFKVLDSLL